jgi:hypothetical protein
MTLILVKPKEVASLPLLYRLILKHIYEPENMSLVDENLMQLSFIHWSKKVDLDDEEQFALGRFAQMLKKDEAGGFNARKQMFKDRGIDYKKFHRLPEAQEMTNARRREIEAIKSTQQSEQ